MPVSPKNRLRRRPQRVIAERQDKVRLVLPLSDDRALIVRDDVMLIEDLDYAPGVMEALQEAWDAHDYFTVDLVDKYGELVDSISSMAGYGGPREAAEAALRDHFEGV